MISRTKQAINHLRLINEDLHSRHTEQSSEAELAAFIACWGSNPFPVAYTTALSDKTDAWLPVVSAQVNADDS